MKLSGNTLLITGGGTMSVLKLEPTPTEICVENVKGLRFAAENGRHEGIFDGLNSSMSDIQ